MKDIDYGFIRLNLKEVMKEQNISINRLAFRAEMQRTQLKAYMNEEVQRIDLYVMARICYAMDCDLSDLLQYVRPDEQQAKDELRQVQDRGCRKIIKLDD